MLAEERYHQILKLLRTERTVKVAELTELFQVSAETVRRDLDYLEKEGCLKKVYGGAVLEQVDSSMAAFKEREHQFQENKLEAAQLVCRFVKEGDSIALDAGTTSLEIAKVLKEKYEKLTILTNSIAIVNELLEKPSFTVMLAGGVVHPAEESIIGAACVEQLRQYRVNFYFLTPSGVSLHSGITSGVASCGFEDVEVQRAMADIAGRVIVLCGSNCFEKVCLLKVCDLIRVECILTDSRLPAEVRKQYETADIKIITPDCE